MGFMLTQETVKWVSETGGEEGATLASSGPAM